MRPTGPGQLPATGAASGTATPGRRWPRSLARVATAPVGHRNRQLWESTRNLYNLVATGALDPRQVDHRLLAAAERCGLLEEEPRQTHRTLASGRQVGLAHPGRPGRPTDPERTHRSPPSLRAMAEQTKERGGPWPPPATGLADLFLRGGRVPPPAEPAPTHHPTGRSSWMGSPPTLDPGPNRPPDPTRQAVASDSELLEHLQTPAAFGGHEPATGPSTRSPAASAATWTPATATTTTAWPPSSPHTHPDLARDPIRDGERTFDRLNPTTASPPTSAAASGASGPGPGGRPALGVRVAVHDSRQNDRNPVIWQAGQDYRMAEALHAARDQPTRARHGPERTGSER